MQRGIILIFLLAALLRCSYILLVPPRPMEWDDSKGWNFVALKFYHGKGFLSETEGMDPKRPPIYPLFLSGIYKLFGQENFYAVKLAQAFLSALTCILFYSISNLLFGPTIALWSGLLSALYPPLIVYSEILVSETLFIALFYSFLFVWIKALRTSQPSLYGLAGFLLGLLNLCKGTLILFPLLLLFIFPFLKKFKKEKISNVLTFVSISFLVLLPWTWRNYKVYGGFIPTASGGAEQFWSGTLPWEEQRLFGNSELMKKIQSMGKTPLETERIFFRDAVARIAEAPLQYLKLTIKKAFFFWFQPIGQKLTERRFPWLGQLLYGLQILLIFLFLYGIILTVHLWKELFPIYLVILYFSGLHILLAPEPRYRLPLEPIFLIFSFISIRFLLWKRV